MTEKINENKNILHRSDRVQVKNLCEWNFYITEEGGNYDSPKGLEFKPNGLRYMPVSEIILQVENGNRAFVGTDDKGTHAKLYICDDNLREQLLCEDQIALTNEKAREILNLSNKKFREAIEKYVILNHEKDKIVKVAQRIKLKEYEKIRFIEEHTGLDFKLDKNLHNPFM